MQIRSHIVCVKIVVFIQFTTIHTWYSVNYSSVRVLYIQPKVHVHVVTDIFSLGCTYLQIVLVQFDNNVSTKPEKYRVSYIGNAVGYTDTLPIQYLQYRHLFRSLGATPIFCFDNGFCVLSLYCLLLKSRYLWFLIIKSVKI